MGKLWQYLSKTRIPQSAGRLEHLVLLRKLGDFKKTIYSQNELIEKQKTLLKKQKTLLGVLQNVNEKQAIIWWQEALVKLQNEVIKNKMLNDKLLEVGGILVQERNKYAKANGWNGTDELMTEEEK